jgi:hypothetical protein
MGGTGAAGVIALALALGGFGAPLPSTPDAFVPVANDGLAGGQVTEAAPTDQPAATTTDLGGGSPQETTHKVIDTVYVLPPPATPTVHTGKPAGDNGQDGGGHNGDGQNGDGQNGDDQNGDDQNGDDQGDEASDDQNGDQGDEADDDDQGDDEGDDEAGEDDHSNDGDHSDDGGEDDHGHEPGDD